mgnify:CR=1 FL=1
MDKPSKNKPAAGRYALLDELRGLDLLSMIGYHACWDLIFLFGMSAAWYTGWQGHLWQQSICWVFILLSGFCLPLGHHPLRRGLIVSGAGVLVTVVTLLFMPEDRVVFGVLTLLGAAMLITGLLQPLLQKIPAWAGLVVSLLLFAATYHTQDGFWQLGPWQILLPGAWYANLFTAFFGFFPRGFFSTDYFPLLPWLFLFWAGYFLHFCMGRARMEPLRRSVCAPLGWLGRHSLGIYLLHQPVIYGVLLLLFHGANGLSQRHSRIGHMASVLANRLHLFHGKNRRYLLGERGQIRAGGYGFLHGKDFSVKVEAHMRSAKNALAR